MVFDSSLGLALHAFISVSLLLLHHSHGIFELVPSGEVYVCTDDTNQLEAVCSSSNSRFLEWNFTFPESNNLSFIRIISESNDIGFVSPFTVGNVRFEFTITKDPLTTRASANQISPVLNGSVIVCRERYITNGSSAEFVVHVVDATTTGSPTIPVVEVISEQYERDNVTVVLEWPNEGGGVAYSASVTPESPLVAEMLAGNGTRGIKLVLLYNRQYNVSTVATLCGVNSTTSITELNYVNCREPTATPRVNLRYNSTLVGSQLLLSCEEDDIVTIAQCSESGTWIPNPAELVCPPSSESSRPPSSTSNAFVTLTDSEPVLLELDNVKTNWVLIGSCISVGLLLGGIGVAIAILIIIAIVKRGWGHQQSEESITAVEHQEKDINMSKNIVYEQVKCRKQKIVLQENVAYCTTSECVSTNIYSVVH